MVSTALCECGQVNDLAYVSDFIRSLSLKAYKAKHEIGRPLIVTISLRLIPRGEDFSKSLI